MLIHREYTNAFPSSLIIYKDKLETKNANKPHLYGQLLPDTFEPFPKNPHLAQIFTQMGRSEELGTGLRNVFKYSKAYSGSDKVIFLEEDIFIVKVPLVNDVTENVTENRIKQILNLVRNNPTISFDELSEQLKVTRMTIYRDMEKLKNKGIIRRIGPDKGGHWEVGEERK